MDEVRVVPVLPLHRREEEELGDRVDGDQDGQEGAEEEILEDDAPPDVKTNDPSRAMWTKTTMEDTNMNTDSRAIVHIPEEQEILRAK